MENSCVAFLKKRVEAEWENNAAAESWKSATGWNYNAVQAWRFLASVKHNE
jgi:hypothetical protein